MTFKKRTVIILVCVFFLVAALAVSLYFAFANMSSATPTSTITSKPTATPKFCIVVARYNENVEWTKPFSNVIIYNKGEPLKGNYNEIFLKNVCKEGHTYYKHIYDNYENLSDYTIFLQGNPFDHSPNIISDLNKYVNNADLNIGFEFLTKRILNIRLSSRSSFCPYHGGRLPFQKTYAKLFNKKMENLKLNFRVGRGKRNDMKLKFGAGAQFIVSKKNILQRPKNFYLKIVRMLGKNRNPIEGYVIERFHELILN